MIDKKIYNLVQIRLRPRRMYLFYKTLGIRRDTKVLDVGGTLFNWKLAPFIPDLTILNIYPFYESLPSNIKWIVGDARCMGFKDKSFDVVFSNSVIEHVGNWEDQIRFAQEIKRVSERYFIQTPNYWFPIETHLITPFIHWLPSPLARSLLRFSMRSLITRDLETTIRFYNEVRLLKPKEMALLFPEATIRYEYLFLFRKSIYAIKEA